MDKKIIGMFAQEYLKSNETVNEYDLQRFILERPEVGISLPLNEIRTALDESYERGELNIVFADGEIAVYKRRIK